MSVFGSKGDHRWGRGTPTVIFWVLEIRNFALSVHIVYAAHRSDHAENAEPKDADDLVFLSALHLQVPDGRDRQTEYQHIQNEVNARAGQRERREAIIRDLVEAGPEK